MRHIFLAVAALATMVINLAHAQGAPDPARAAVTARQAHMQLYQFNLGLLGGMAQGAIDYDAEAATSAAANLAALAGLEQGRYWLGGTAAGEVEGSRAAPDLWANMDDLMTRTAAMETAALAMAEAAGSGIDALRGAMGDLGGSCSACHQSYRLRN